MASYVDLFGPDPTPGAGRHAAAPPDCPDWCDPRRCVTSIHGGIHVGTASRWFSTVADVEFSLSRYQDVGEPETYLLTLRRLATNGPVEVTVSDADLDQLAAIHARLRNTGTPLAEIVSSNATTGDGADGDSSDARAITG